MFFCSGDERRGGREDADSLEFFSRNDRQNGVFFFFRGIILRAD